jgi:hypothetical protein
MQRTFTHHWRRGLVGALAIASSLTVAFPANATAPRTKPTGPAKTLAYYLKTSDNMNKLPYLSEVSNGDFWLLYYTNGSWELWANQPKKPAADAVAVTDTEITASSHGKIVWSKMVFAAECASGQVCFSTLTPVEFYFDQKNAYFARLTGTDDTPGCWTQATATTDSWIKNWNSDGSPNWYPGTSTSFATASAFQPMVTKGDTVTVTSTYSYTSDKAKVTEVDSIDSKTVLFTATSLTVGKGAGKDEPAYKNKTTFSVPKSAPKAPKLRNYCH